MALQFSNSDRFEFRHIGPKEKDVELMLKDIGVNNLNELISLTVPDQILLDNPIKLESPITEFEYLNEIELIAAKNRIFKSYIGMGYYQTITPTVIKRNILQNPGWYTQYTPYQSEISQGRLEALINFQTMVSDLTGMPLANASLLDEGTAASEAMLMFFALRKKEKKNSNKYFVDSKTFPQTIEVLKTRALPLGIELVISNYREVELTNDFFGLLVQYPNSDGDIIDYSDLFKSAEKYDIFKSVASDLLSLTLFTPPGEIGADAVVGSTQRFGVPMGYGGPHAAYFATKEDFKRFLPGRIIGASVDLNGRPAFRMALQTREQHIKREKATSNICTAQVLLAVMAGMYAVYHGPKGLKNIAKKIFNLTSLLKQQLIDLGYEIRNKNHFDTLTIDIHETEILNRFKELFENNEINLRYENNSIGISIDEVKSIDDINQLVKLFSELKGIIHSENIMYNSFDIPLEFERKSEYLSHPVFNKYFSETEMMRYIKYLEKKDLSLTTSMIPLGSCTMKLNAATEMEALTLSKFSDLHPFAPMNQAEGYRIIINKLEKYLNEITGFSATSLQPNSGAQGEYTGLMVIRAYQSEIGESHRNVILIPSSAHGTNPASAVMAGANVVIVKCDEQGDIDLEDLNQKAEKYSKELCAIMVTYPSTHGVFEEKIVEITEIIHKHGGQVYMDGANLNAQIGLTSPAKIGADVCHINLHKTFSIPHGGGGPGMGPIAVAPHLAPFLPGHIVTGLNYGKSITSVSSAPYGSASILTISYSYIRMMGAEGLTNASKIAILNANYIKAKLENDYKVLFSGKKNHVAHELIFDLREFKHSVDIEAEDVAKRLMDYGYHAPTVSFPVPGTLMVEPTESESKTEIDNFIKAMKYIREEIREIEIGKADRKNNVLKNAPHTAEIVISDEWDKPYSREKAAFPISSLYTNKFWPSVSRVDNAYGDRNLFCSCLPISDYEE